MRVAAATLIVLVPLLAAPASAATVTAQDGQCAYTGDWRSLLSLYAETGPAACASLEIRRNGDSYSWFLQANARDLPDGEYAVAWCSTFTTVQVILTECDAPPYFCRLGECFLSDGRSASGYGMRSICVWAEVARDGARVAYASACA